jgi:hypothetical protein
MNEIWNFLENSDNQYQISNAGRFKSIFRRRYCGKNKGLKIVYSDHLYSLYCNNGYMQVTFSQKNFQKTEKIHKLVAKYFIPNPNNYPEINHKNGISIDNRVENLEWCNRQQNMQHAHKMGLMNMEKGEERYNVKLTEAKVKEIRKLRKENKIPTRKLAKMFEVSRSTIIDILTKRRWKHVE